MNKKPGRLDERAIDKKMFATMRMLRENPNFEEQSSDNMEDEPNMEPQQMDNLGEKPVISPSNQDVAQEQEKFRQTIAVDTQFKEFSILAEENNIIFSGTIPGLCDFVFELNQAEGFGISIPNQTTMTPKKVKILETMNGYYENWRGDMFKKLREYQHDSND